MDHKTRSLRGVATEAVLQKVLVSFSHFRRYTNAWVKIEFYWTNSTTSTKVSCCTNSFNRRPSDLINILVPSAFLSAINNASGFSSSLFLWYLWNRGLHDKIWLLNPFKSRHNNLIVMNKCTSAYRPLISTKWTKLKPYFKWPVHRQVTSSSKNRKTFTKKSKQHQTDNSVKFQELEIHVVLRKQCLTQNRCATTAFQNITSR